MGYMVPHKQAVFEQMQMFANGLMIRAQIHDESKMTEPELSGFAEDYGLLKTLEFGSADWRLAMSKLKPIIEAHYNNNDHHPEHFDNGVNGMHLIQLIEMLADWYAASSTTKDGNIERSIRVGIERFGIGSQLADIIWNTATTMGWVDVRPLETDGTDGD